MKIIKEGNGENWALLITCEHIKDENGFEYDQGKERCGSILEIEKSDVYVREFHKYPDYNGKDYVCFCPKCGSCLEINQDKIPEWVKNQAKDYKEYKRQILVTDTYEEDKISKTNKFVCEITKELDKLYKHDKEFHHYFIYDSDNKNILQIKINKVALMGFIYLDNNSFITKIFIHTDSIYPDNINQLMKKYVGSKLVITDYNN